MLEKLQECQDRFEAVNEMLADPATARQPQEYQKLAREVGELREVVEVGARYRELETSIGEAEEIIDEGSDADLVELARSEIEQLRSEREALEDKLEKVVKLFGYLSDKVRALFCGLHSVHHPLGGGGAGRCARGVARSRVGPPEPVAPAAPSDPERR